VDCRAVSSLKRIVVLTPLKFTSTATMKLYEQLPVKFWRIIFIRMTEFIHIRAYSWRIVCREAPLLPAKRGRCCQQAEVDCAVNKMSWHHYSKQHRCWRLVEDCFYSLEQFCHVLSIMLQYTTSAATFRHVAERVKWHKNICLPWHLISFRFGWKRGVATGWTAPVRPTSDWLMAVWQ